MDRDRRTAIVAGVLFIVATVSSVVGRVAMLGPVLEGTDYLTRVAASQNQVAAGALLGLLAALASSSIAIALYPVLRRQSEGLALGSVGLRVFEGALYSLGPIAVLSLLTLVRGAAAGGASALASLEPSGALLMALRGWGGMAGTLAFYPAGLLYYFLFFRSKLLPRWLSGLGIVAVVMGFTATILVIFQVIVPMSAPQVLLNLPIAVQELILAVWLIARGFNPSALAAVRG